MLTDMNIRETQSGSVEFEIALTNDTDGVLVLHAQKLERSAARVGLLIRSQGEVLEPIEFNVVSYSISPQEIDLKPGASYCISLRAQSKKIGKTSWGLIFDGATYKVEPETVYEVQFSHGTYRSGIMEWSFVR